MNESINSNSSNIKLMLNELKKQSDKKQFLTNEEQINEKINQEEIRIHEVLKEYLKKNDIIEVVTIQPAVRLPDTKSKLLYTVEVKHLRFSFTIEGGGYILSFTNDDKTKLTYEVRFDDDLNVRWKRENSLFTLDLEDVIADAFVILIDGEIKKYQKENDKIPNKENFKEPFHHYQ